MYFTFVYEHPLSYAILQYKGSGMDGFLGFFRPGGGVPEGDMLRSIKFTAATRTSLQFLRYESCLYVCVCCVVFLEIAEVQALFYVSGFRGCFVVCVFLYSNLARFL